MAVHTSMPSTTDIVLQDLKGRRLDWKGIVFQAMLLFSLLISLGVLLVLLVDVVAGGLVVFTDRGFEFLRANVSTLPDLSGVAQGISGSLLLMLFVVTVAFPLGIGAAVYLEEYAKDTRFNRFISVNIRNLAGVPSVVYGLLGLAIFVKLLVGFTGGRSVISAGLTLAIVVLPIVIITSAEALRAVPDSIREAGYGVGATRWEVIRSHVLPSAAPGILTGTVLSLSRALGETAPLLMVGAVSGFFVSSADNFLETLRNQFQSLPTIIFNWARLPDSDFRALTSAAIVVLLLLTLTANAAAIILRNRYERKW
ncbi:MAG: phosphate ABC transporter permease PstA [Actinomycetota bacterium]